MFHHLNSKKQNKDKVVFLYKIKENKNKKGAKTHLKYDQINKPKSNKEISKFNL